MKKYFILLLLIGVLLLFGCLGQKETTGDNGQAGTANSGSTVTINDFAFDPPTLTVKKGTTVKWSNEDSAEHTIKFEFIESENLGEGDSFEYIFTEIGSYAYICGPHTFMEGTIIVEE